MHVHDASAPAQWLVDHRQLLPPRGTALDLACGRGRHALWLARQGLTVVALDRNADQVRALAAEAEREGLDLRAEVRDLESADPDLGIEQFDVIVGVRYLHRPLFPHLVAALRPGGILVYETFTRQQAQRGRPTSPAYLLEPGELLRLVAPLHVIAARECEVDGQFVASIVARKGPAGG